MSKNIAIIGRGLTNNRWDLIYKILDKSAVKEIFYERFDINNPKALEQFKKKDSDVSFNGVVYICTTADKINDNRPYIKFNIKSTNEDIINGIKSLACQMSSKRSNMEEVNISNDDNNIDNANNACSINSVIVDISGKKITINKNDFDKLERLRSLLDKYDYKIVDIVLDES
ncbi:MAG: hypothetical protein RBR68_07345 [Tenuifilaceae bacterium]|nr:hypothetical protein [Tenuifilaceae bacterium]